MLLNGTFDSDDGGKSEIVPACPLTDGSEPIADDLISAILLQRALFVIGTHLGYVAHRLGLYPEWLATNTPPVLIKSFTRSTTVM